MLKRYKNNRVISIHRGVNFPCDSLTISVQKNMVAFSSVIVGVALACSCELSNSPRDLLASLAGSLLETSLLLQLVVDF